MANTARSFYYANASVRMTVKMKIKTLKRRPQQGENLLVPTLPRGNAYPSIFFRNMGINVIQPVLVDLYPMRYHAERGNDISCFFLSS